MKKYLKCIIAVAFVLSCFNPIMEAKRKNAEILNTDPEFFMTEEARRIGDQVILYQRVTGGWPKTWRGLLMKKMQQESLMRKNAAMIPQPTIIPQQYRWHILPGFIKLLAM